MWIESSDLTTGKTSPNCWSDWFANVVNATILNTWWNHFFTCLQITIHNRRDTFVCLLSADWPAKLHQHAVQKFDYLKNDHALHSTPKKKCIFSDKIVLSLLGVLDPNYLWFPILQSLFFDCWCMRCTPAASVTVAKLANKQKNIQPVVQHWDSERMQAQLSTWSVNHTTRTQGQWTIHKTDKYMQNVAGWCDPWTKYHWKNCW